MVFAVGNVFSDLYREKMLWIAPLCSGTFLLIAMFLASQIRRKFLISASLSFGTSLILCLLLFGTGKIIARDNFYQIEKHPAHIELMHPGRGKSAYVMPDPRVLGRTYGKQIRKLAPDYHHLYVEWIDYTNHPSFPQEKTFDEILIFGAQHFQYAKFAKNLTIPTILIHPIGYPGFQDTFSIQKLILPEIDITGGSDQSWKDWAIEKGVPVCYSQNTGTDIRLDWPAILDRSSIRSKPEKTSK